MDRREKSEKREVISNSGIDISRNRFSDNEVDRLYEFATNEDDYIGRTNHKTSSHDGWCSDGKYTRTETYDYEITRDDNGLGINENYSYYDDDGASGSSNTRYNTGRDILNMLHKF